MCGARAGARTGAAYGVVAAAWERILEQVAGTASVNSARTGMRLVRAIDRLLEKPAASKSKRVCS